MNDLRHARRADVDEPAPTFLATSAGWSGVVPKGPPSRSRPADSAERPPFAVPSLAEIAAGEPNGLTVASTFAGAGGSSTGWEIAGYRVKWACEFHPPAADSYAANHPATVLDRRDVRIVTGAEIVDACGGVVPDVLDGSPPCQDFSLAGKRSRGWGEERAHGDGTHQRSDDLFAEYTRLVGELHPRAFVAENVKGLVTGVAKGQFKRIMAGLSAQGYRVRAKVLDAQWLGVPQRRKRVIIIGVRDDLGAEPTFPVPLPYRYSMLDACPWLGGQLQFRSRGQFADEDADVGRDPAMTITVQNHHHIHLSYDDHCWRAGAVGEITDPAATVAAAGIHGVTNAQAFITDGHEQRRLTIEEVKRFCSFPDDYVLTGNYTDQWARLGNSVPPLMMAAVGRALAPVLGAAGAAG